MTPEVCNKMKGHARRCRNVAVSDPDHFQNARFNGETRGACSKRVREPLAKRFPGKCPARLRVYALDGTMLEFETGLPPIYAKRLLRQFSNVISGRDPMDGDEAVVLLRRVMMFHYSDRREIPEQLFDDIRDHLEPKSAE